MNQPQPISLNDLKALLALENNTVRLIDIRTAEEYNKQHIPVAENIPAETLDSISFLHDDTIICVCNHGKHRSQDAAAFLIRKGYTNTFYLEGGTATWFHENNEQHH